MEKESRYNELAYYNLTKCYGIVVAPVWASLLASGVLMDRVIIRRLGSFWLLLGLLCLSTSLLAEVRIASWNIQHFGWGEKKNYEAVAAVVERFDLVAIVELMRPEALQDLEQRLQRRTGESWASLASEALGRSSYREHYGFIWRESAVSYVDGAVVFIDGDDTFAREPFSARFHAHETDQVFALAVIHVLYGASVRERVPELHALADYWDWLAEIYPDTPRVLAGDFNIVPQHPALEALRLKAKPLITEGASTLSTYDGRYANLYDNLWVEPDELLITGSGIGRFPEWLGMTHQQARASVSDHAPVYLLLGERDAARAEISQSAQLLVASSRSCIDLNAASAEILTQLPHIGPARALAIINGRPWQKLEDLVRIRGITLARVAEMQATGLLCENL